MNLMPWILITVAIIGIDQVSKATVMRLMTETESIEVIKGFFHIIHVENSGAAWSLFRNGRYVFIVLTVISLFAMAYFAVKMPNRLFRFSISVLAGGAAGNLIDRIVKGSVTDFLSFNFGSYHFPAFNAADMSIVAGSALLAFFILFRYDNVNSKGIGQQNGGGSS